MGSHSDSQLPIVASTLSRELQVGKTSRELDEISIAIVHLIVSFEEIISQQTYEFVSIGFSIYVYDA